MNATSPQVERQTLRKRCCSDSSVSNGRDDMQLPIKPNCSQRLIVGVACLNLTFLGLGLQSGPNLRGEEPKARVTLPGHTTCVWSVAFSPDGKALASGSRDGSIKIWDVATGKEQADLKGHANMVMSVSFSPDGRILASGSSDGTIKALGRWQSKATSPHQWA